MKAFWDDEVEAKFKLSNTDKSDGFREVAVSEYNTSDDPTTTFFQYDGDAIREIGSLEGFCGNYNGQSHYLRGDVIIDGTGIIKTRTRGNVLLHQKSDTAYQYIVSVCCILFSADCSLPK